ncbi:hypothetical protein, partial [Serratia marcescens]
YQAFPPGGSLVRSPVPAFRFTGVIPLLWPRFLIPRLTLGSGKAVRSKLDCMHEPPVQSDRCALSGNYRLESNPERHDKTPLAAATGNRISRARYVGGATEFLKWWPNYGYTGRTVFGICALLKPVTRLSSSPTDLTFEKPPPQAVFSFTEQEITRTERGSQEDRKKKVNMSVFIPQKEGF